MHNHSYSPITHISKIIPHASGIEIRIDVTAYTGAGLHQSIGVDVYRRDNASSAWQLCNNLPHPDWRTMSVDEYNKHGRSEVLQLGITGQILALRSQIGKPMSSLH